MGQVRTEQSLAGFISGNIIVTPGEIDVDEMVDIFSLMYSVQVNNYYYYQGRREGPPQFINFCY